MGIGPMKKSVSITHFGVQRSDIPPPWLKQITGARGTLVPFVTVMSEMFDMPRRINEDVRMPINVSIANRLKVMVGNLRSAMRRFKRPLIVN